MRDLSIGGRLFLGFGISLLLLVLSNGLGFRSLSINDQRLKEVAEQQRLSEKAASVRNNVTRIIDASKSLILIEDVNTKKQVLGKIAEIRNLYKEDLDALVKDAKTDEGRRKATALRDEIAAGRSFSVKLIELAMQNDRQGFVTLWQNESNPRNERIMVHCDEMRDYFAKRATESSVQAQASNEEAKLVAIGFSILALVFSVAVAAYSTRKITQPIHRCVKVAEQIASGNLAVGIDVHGTGETALLLGAMRDMTLSLKQTMATLNNASFGVSSAATELRATSGVMAEGAAEVVAQASSVATAGEEMASTAQDIAQSCHRTANSADQASAAAVEGFKVVENSVRVMETIAKRVKSASESVDALGSRSEQIGEIIGTIEDIADQTNLLALNAAIEAARAGEQGRGFAVVADEVRALAERTGKATREIDVMIKTIQSETKGAVSVMEEGVREVEKGTAEAAKSGQALQAILDQINSVTLQANQIATAAEEQTATTYEISSNMQGITNIVERSAAGAQETASAASQLTHLAVELQQIVSKYQVA